MERDKLTRLLNAFYEGGTTKEEEQELYRYFTSAAIPEELEDDRRVFLNLYGYSTDDDTVDTPSSLNDKLSSLIDNLAEKEKPKTKRVTFTRIASIAASLLILVSVGLFVFNGKHPQATLTDTYTDPQEAYIETQKTLAMVSSALNSGLDPLKRAGDDISKANQIVNESLGKIR